MLTDADLTPHFGSMLTGIHLSGLPIIKCARGKVRDSFLLSDGTRLIVTTDRLSVFDHVVGYIPFKGQLVNQIALHWFQKTSDIVANHMLAVLDPNVILAEELTMIPIEVVVRAYMTGSSKTSLWSLYKDDRDLYGLKLPAGLRENQLLPQVIVTPTTKADRGQHDKPISANEIVTKGLLSGEKWEEITSIALRLFSRGSTLAREQGLILVDTKYEFGFSTKGTLVVADEIHTPDNSRYWYAESYETRIVNGEQPDNLDKDFARAWVIANSDLYHQRLPSIPTEISIEFARRYIKVYETITGQTFVLPTISSIPPIQRICANIKHHLVSVFPFLEKSLTCSLI